MPMRWRGAAVEARVVEASKRAIDRVMAECVIEAKEVHPYQNRTGTAEGSVRIVEEADFIESRLAVEGQWGSADVNYFIFLELGTVNMEALPSLRPAADKWYPSLKLFIAEEMAV